VSHGLDRRDHLAARHDRRSYRVEAELGRGATAVVYRVEDERSGQRLALKQLTASAEPPSDVMRAISTCLEDARENLDG
jgi:serine/threonine protein kinase